MTVAALLTVTIPALAQQHEQPTLDKGHRILIKRGLQIHALVFVEDPFELAQLKAANFTGVNFAWNSDMKKLGPPPTPPGEGVWSRWSSGADETQLKPDEQPYAKNLIAWACADESNLNEKPVRDKIAAWFASTRASGNFADTILYTNQYGGQVTNENMGAYLSAAKPDMLSFDTYPFLLDGPVAGSPTPFYGDAMRYRKLALGAGGKWGVPYAMWLQTFHGENRYRDPSESEMRLNQFAAWTFGYKFVTAFTYNSGATNLFKGPGDRNPTDALRQIAKINRESLNLGPALVRLGSADVRIIMGERKGGDGKPVSNPQPIDVQPWRFGENDPYLRGVTAENLGPTNDRLRGDVLLGWFKPLAPSDARHADETYLMITNGLCSPPPAGSAAACRQRITLNFHFKDSRVTRLQRLSRSTGKVETVELKGVPNDPGRFVLTLELDGGTGDLLKFDTGAPFVGMGR